jgi:hypothetical protein
MTGPSATIASTIADAPEIMRTVACRRTAALWSLLTPPQQLRLEAVMIDHLLRECCVQILSGFQCRRGFLIRQ